MTQLFPHRITLPDGTEARQVDVGHYLLDFHRSGSTLVITFENRDYGAKDPCRFGWGFQKIRQLGHSVLAVKVKRPDWYLQPDLGTFLNSPAVRALLCGFDRVLLYGSSMGGYAALRYAVPGSQVLALNPQTSLATDLVPDENRFPDGSVLDWSDPLSDAIIGAKRADRLFVAYDPLCSRDRRHVDRLDDANLTPLKLPLVGHTLPAHLAYMGLIETVLDLFLRGDLTSTAWSSLMRRRRTYSHYYLTLALHPRTSREVAARALELAFRNKPVLPNGLDQLAAAAERHGLWEEAKVALRGYRDLMGDAAEENDAVRRIMQHASR